MSAAATARTSLVVASYNQPNALALVLAGIAAQDLPIDEIAFADDGSEPDTLALVERFRAQSEAKVLWTTQEDRGFRKAKALNNAIRATTGEIVLFLDGDCIPPRGWARMFVEALQRWDFATAGYVLMDLERTKARTIEEVASGAIDRVITTAERAEFASIHRKERLYKLLRKRKKPKILGGNWAARRAALVKVNGFDERFDGFGKEDSDIRNRLQNSGCRGVSLWDRNWVFHCCHDVDPRRTLPSVVRRPGTDSYYPTRLDARDCELGLEQRGGTA